jgi:hypothetical protein
MKSAFIFFFIYWNTSSWTAKAMLHIIAHSKVERLEEALSNLDACSWLLRPDGALFKVP